MATRTKLNSRGMEALLKSAEVRADLTDRMESALAAAKANAPVDTGEYRDSLDIAQHTTDRAVVRIVSTAPHGMLVEANTGNLARALDSAR